MPRTSSPTARMPSPLGLGCMGLSGIYEDVDRDTAIRTIHEALDQGITLLDTADFYGKGERTPGNLGHNEELVGEAIRGKRDEIFLCTKGGQYIADDGTPAANGRPDYIRGALHDSLRRLGVENVDVYYVHRVDPDVPIEETFGALAEEVGKGTIRALGISEPSIETLMRAHEVHPVSFLQNEYSLVTREPEDEMLPTARSIGATFVAFASLGRGMLTGAIRAHDSLREGDARHLLPRFQGENLAANLELIESFASLAERVGCESAQLALAWLVAKGGDVIPLFGAATPEIAASNARAADIELDATTLEELDQLFPPGAAAGARYPKAWLKMAGR